MSRALPNLLVLLSAALALGACDGSGGPASASSATSRASPAPSAAAACATITVDAAHDVMTRRDAPAYAIAPAAELLVEIGDYRFPTRDGGPSAPDAVHVIHGTSDHHRASLSGKRVTLGVGSLDPVKRSAFQGFEAGESYTVALGAEITGADGAMRFVPLWTTKVNVAAR